MTLGNASGDDVTVTGSLASTIPIKTNNTYDVGSATLGLRKLYLGNGGAGATCDIVAASHSTTREYTVPDCGAAASFVMTAVAQTIGGAKTFSSGIVVGGNTTGDSNLGTISSVTLGLFYKGTFPLTVTGGVDAGAVTVTCYYEKIDNTVTLHIPDATDTSNAATQVYLTSIPSALRPARNQNFLARVVDNSVVVHGFAQIATNGDINIFNIKTGSFIGFCFKPYFPPCIFNTILGGSTFGVINSKGLSASTFTYTLA